MPRFLFSRSTLHAARAVTAAALALTLLTPELAAAADLTQPPKPLTAQQRTQHALSRFTFGARPGEEQAVAQEGLDHWFERQLHPDRLDDTALAQRLAAFPALQLDQTALIEHFPSPLHIRALLRTNTSIPHFKDPVQNAIYQDYMARYKFGLRLAAKGGKQGNINADTVAEAYRNPLQPKSPAPDDQQMAGDQRPPTRDGKRSGLERAATDPLPPSTLTFADAQTILALAPADRFARIVALSPGDHLRFVVLTANRLNDVLAGFTPEQREAYGAMINPSRVVTTEVLEARLLRDIYSERELQSVLTDFWLNHFSVYVRKNQNEPYLLNSYEHDAILPNALGNFERMLVATAMSPAMLVYLDNWQSIGPNSRAAERSRRVQPAGNQTVPKGLNENYARELMELHTVGVDGGYTQRDVIEVAKCFSGWTIQRPYGLSQGDGQMTFTFDPRRHEPGSKTVLGVTIPEGGMQEGLTVLHILASSPKTAHFISQKLAVRFVSDNPPAALVDRMAATFQQTHGDIPAVLRTLYKSPEFWSPAAFRAKVKTPVEFLVSAARASAADVTDAGVLVQAVERLGMPVFGMQTPQGYSWQSADWVSSGALVNRMNFALLFAGDRIRGTGTDWTRLVPAASAAAPTPANEEQLEYAILGSPATPHTRATVLDQFKNSAVLSEAQQGFALPERSPASDDSDDIAMATPRRPGLGKGKGRNANAFSFNAGTPATPLATMAGLLLGSPDFQRR